MVIRRLLSMAAFACSIALAIPGDSDAGQVSPPPAALHQGSTDAARDASAGQTPAFDAVSIERIRRELSREPSLVLPTDPPMFVVYIEGKLPSLDSFFGPGWTQGPASPMAMSHREFLNMVTPKMAQPYGSFGPKELAVLLPQALATGLLVNYLPNAIKGFVSDRRAAAARREVQEVLAELERRRLEAEAGAAAIDPPR